LKGNPVDRRIEHQYIVGPRPDLTDRDHGVGAFSLNGPVEGEPDIVGSAQDFPVFSVEQQQLLGLGLGQHHAVGHDLMLDDNEVRRQSPDRGTGPQVLQTDPADYGELRSEGRRFDSGDPVGHGGA
jgi:hypothetical protein